MEFRNRESPVCLGHQCAGTEPSSLAPSAALPWRPGVRRPGGDSAHPFHALSGRRLASKALWRSTVLGIGRAASGVGERLSKAHRAVIQCRAPIRATARLSNTLVQQQSPYVERVQTSEVPANPGILKCRPNISNDPNVAGVIESIHVTKGDRVSEGYLINTIEAAA